MKKTALILSLIIVVMAGWWLTFITATSTEKNFVDKLREEGVAREAVIVKKRQYFPPKGKEAYGEIFYRYHNIRGEELEGRQAVSEELFSTLNLDQFVDILYDPDNTKKSRLAQLVREAVKT